MDTSKAVKNIKSIYERRIAALYALSLNYAAISLNYFRQAQSNNKFWNNQTYDAMNRVFTDAQIQGSTISWGMAHGVAYGIALELANNGRHAAITPVIRRFAPRFFRDVQEIYSDN